MSKSLQAMLAVAVITGGMIFTIQSAQAGGCGTRVVYGGHVVSSCHTPVHVQTYYGGYTLLEMKQLYVMFDQNPILCQRHPELALALNRQFKGDLVIPGVQAEVAVAETAVAAEGAAVVATPAATPAVVAEEPAAVVAEPAAATPAVATPAVATPAAPVAEPAIDATPTDLPAGGPAGLPADLPADLPAGDAPIDAAPIEAGAAAAGVPAELEPLLGLWENEGGAEDIGSVSQINLSKDGTATVTLNTAIGPATMTKPFAVEDSNFNLIDGEKKITLGQVLSADADRVVLKSGEATLTFTRPS